MPVEKSPYLYNPAEGDEDIEKGVFGPQDIEVEIELPDEEEGQDAQEPQASAMDAGHDENLADKISAEVNLRLAQELMQAVDEDDNSRDDWMKTYKKGLELIGLKIEERSDPWEGASGIVYPMLAEAALKFQAELTVETFPAQGPVLTKILGDETPQAVAIGNRVKEDMNYLLTTKYREFRTEHEKALWTCALAGSAFKKVYFDGALERPVSKFIPPEDVIVNYGESDIFNAERVTHEFSRSKVEMKRLVANGLYIDGAQVSLPDQNEVSEAKDRLIGQERTGVLDEDFQLREIYCYLDDEELVGEDGLPAPFIVTVDRGSNKIIGLYRNWEEQDPKQKKRQYLVHYPYILGFGFYGLGLIHIAGNFADSATSIMRQLIDAGTLANLPGGFKTRMMKIKQDDSPIAPGEWRDVDVTSGTLKESLLPLPYKEPSGTLFELLKNIIDAGYRVASVTDLKVGDMKQDAPVGTTLALLERMLKPMTAVQARIHAALTDEIQMLKALILKHEAPQYEYPQAPKEATRQQDYATVQILPVTDPNATTLTQRIAQFQTVSQLATTAPEIYDKPLMHRMLLEHIGIKYADKFIPDKTKVEPRDPVTENMAILNGQPVKAGLTQNHEAHLQTHLMLAQDPQLTQLIGQSPNAATIQGAMAAHIAEHVAFKYRQQMEKAMGITLPPPEQPLPPEIEVQLSALMAQAAPQVQGQSAAELAAQQAADPLFQIQQREIAVKEAEVQRKKEKDVADTLLEAAKLGIDGQVTVDQAQAEAESRQQELAFNQQKHEQKMAHDKEMQEHKAALQAQESERKLAVGGYLDMKKMEQADAMTEHQIDLAKKQGDAKLEQGNAQFQQKLKQGEEAHKTRLKQTEQTAKLAAKVKPKPAPKKPTGGTK